MVCCRFYRYYRLYCNYRIYRVYSYIQGTSSTCFILCLRHVYIQCICPSDVCIIDGYEYWLIGQSSSVIQCFQFLPSSDFITDTGVRSPLPFFIPFGIGRSLHISTCVPSFSVTASRPLLLLGVSMSCNLDHVSLLSELYVMPMCSLRVRATAAKRPS